eukprot:CAMPEP_0184319390 /NCGR_PEP_ID=MMETSP1049-20130417/108233_1 /TAXON_ID=77928 /ORGANISM="Proteomonas sulcata, Strain CCMP704" /LENGTH=130 /DNA_ID=CAMNT_0026639505 /DNA_START=98 /DNA_END=487 /DNA_ORIENTATION=+
MSSYGTVQNTQPSSVARHQDAGGRKALVAVLAVSLIAATAAVAVLATSDRTPIAALQFGYAMPAMPLLREADEPKVPAMPDWRSGNSQWEKYSDYKVNNALKKLLYSEKKQQGILNQISHGSEERAVEEA